MPRASSKKTGQSNSTASTDLFRSASTKASSKELERIDQLFYTYANRSSGLIDPEGIEALCSDMEVDHTDVRILMLAWKMQAEKQGYFTQGWMNIAEDRDTTRQESCPKFCVKILNVVNETHKNNLSLANSTKFKSSIPLHKISGPAICRAEKSNFHVQQEEWRRSLKALRVDTIEKLKKALPDLEKEVRRTSNFVDFYQYAFRYCLTEEKQKSIDIESICQLLDLVLGSQFRAQVDYFIEYLKMQTDYKVINMDQWMGFYRFCNEISFPDFSNYDPDLAWPLILDNFVDWMKAKQS
ncbi:hypothetical protein Cgig2_014613 [Carnegiea gigantea]|uniref:Defective in cullin neddylation protein n=1 Tax=Carnegiea gigantea TaxID=171969 RepID=A0A9Q1QUL6_9CARY|nr:hypothetical protein Cgig2_014613 [Carnegiea gigantea]